MSLGTSAIKLLATALWSTTRLAYRLSRMWMRIPMCVEYIFLSWVTFNIAHPSILALVVLADWVARNCFVYAHSLSTILHQRSCAWLRRRVPFNDRVRNHNRIRLLVVHLLISLTQLHILQVPKTLVAWRRMAGNLVICAIRRCDVNFVDKRPFIWTRSLFKLKSSVRIYFKVLVQNHVGSRRWIVDQRFTLVYHIWSESNLRSRIIVKSSSLILRNIQVRVERISNSFIIFKPWFTGWFWLVTRNYGHLCLSRIWENGLNSCLHAFIWNGGILILRNQMYRLTSEAYLLSLQMSPIGIWVGPVNFKVLINILNNIKVFRVVLAYLVSSWISTLVLLVERVPAALLLFYFSWIYAIAFWWSIRCHIVMRQARYWLLVSFCLYSPWWHLKLSQRALRTCFCLAFFALIINLADGLNI